MDSRKSTEDRRQLLHSYIADTRAVLVRLLLLVRWLDKVPIAAQSQATALAYDTRSSRFRRIADELYSVANDLPSAFSATFDVQVAADVLCTEKGCGYRRLPFLNYLWTSGAVPLSDDLAQDTVQCVNGAIVSQLTQELQLTTECLRHLRFRCTGDAALTLISPGEYEVLLTLLPRSSCLVTGPSSRATTPAKGETSFRWFVLGFRPLLQASEDFDASIPEEHKAALIHGVNQSLSNSQKPLYVIQKVFHCACLVHAMECLRTQVDRCTTQYPYMSPVRHTQAAEGLDDVIDFEYWRTGPEAAPYTLRIGVDLSDPSPRLVIRDIPETDNECRYHPLGELDLATILLAAVDRRRIAMVQQCRDHLQASGFSVADAGRLEVQHSEIACSPVTGRFLILPLEKNRACIEKCSAEEVVRFFRVLPADTAAENQFVPAVPVDQPIGEKVHAVLRRAATTVGGFSCESSVAPGDTQPSLILAYNPCDSMAMHRLVFAPGGSLGKEQAHPLAGDIFTRLLLLHQTMRRLGCSEADVHQRAVEFLSYVRVAGMALCVQELTHTLRPPFVLTVAGSHLLRLTFPGQKELLVRLCKPGQVEVYHGPGPAIWSGPVTMVGQGIICGISK
eukprot:TRINITY_DN2958_c0_g1_i1.p1 TRINITY_DN2958_c0_g1~~TRINITY_DN2958_c0_g1_i1.p1  ORF type:complete len:652 (-),score=53.01 TRINITY_DN2958_c0_g1_i1:2239-4095(-)